MNNQRSTAITISTPQNGVSRSARRRQRRRANQQNRQNNSAPVKVEVNPVPARSQRRRQRARRPNGRGNPYLATILDPENVRGVKIPDAITLPTGTWSFTQDGTITQAQGNTALIVVSPYNIANSGFNTLGSQVVTINGNAVGVADFTLSAAASPTNPTTAVWMARLRPVSGMVSVWSTQPAINMAGSVCSFLIPEGTKGLNLTTFPAYTSLPYNRVGHIAEGGIARWMATDPSEFDFIDVDAVTASPGWTQSSGIFTGCSQGASVFGCAATGLSAGALLRYRVVINYEFTPGTDVVSFIDRESSPSQPGWLSAVNSFFVKHSTALFTPNITGELARLATRVGTDVFSRVSGSALGSLSRTLAQDQRMNQFPRLELL